jgi:hypothetical protein
MAVARITSTVGHGSVPVDKRKDLSKSTTVYLHCVKKKFLLNEVSLEAMMIAGQVALDEGIPPFSPRRLRSQDMETTKVD